MAKIYLSPSSQTDNVWKDGSGDTEAERMQEISDLVKAGLKAKNHTVYGSDNSLTLSERIKESNKKNVDVHVAIHSNSGGGNGPEVWYCEGSTKGKALAKKLDGKLNELYGSSRGIKADNEDVKEPALADAVAALIEVAFHDSKSDCKWMKNNKKQIAKAIVNGICEYL